MVINKFNEANWGKYQISQIDLKDIFPPLPEVHHMIKAIPWEILIGLI